LQKPATQTKLLVLLFLSLLNVKEYAICAR